MHEDLVVRLQARNAMPAQLAVFQAGTRAQGSLLDVYA